MSVRGDGAPVLGTGTEGRADTIPAVMASVATASGGITFTDSRLTASRFSYRSLTTAGLVAAARLAECGVGRGDIVCFLARTEPGLLTSLLGAWHLGAIPTLMPLPRKLDDSDQVGEVLRRVVISDAQIIVATDAIASALPPGALPVPVVRLSDLATGSPSDEPPAARASDIALLQFTSGTTSMARAVPVEHRQLLENTSAVTDIITPRPGDVLVSWLPLYHDMGIISLIGIMVEGKDAVIMSPDEFLRRPGAWMAALHTFRGTGTVAPNFAYGLAARDLARRPPTGLDLSHVRCAMNGAEPIDLDALDAFATAAAPFGFRREALCPMYGLAEATLAVTITAPDEPVVELWVERDSLEPGGVPVITGPDAPGSRRLAGCGSPIKATEVVTVGPDGATLPIGAVGEIAINGPGVMSGYRFDTGSGEDTFTRDGRLLTGDIGFERDGQWFICGRRKDMMILGGRNFYPEDYEAIADGHDGLRFGKAVAFSLPGTERMVLVAEAKSTSGDADAVAREVLETVRAKLNHAPHHVVLVPARSIPRTSSGKRKRSACRDLYLAGDLRILGQAQ